MVFSVALSRGCPRLALPTQGGSAGSRPYRRASKNSRGFAPGLRDGPIARATELPDGRAEGTPEAGVPKVADAAGQSCDPPASRRSSNRFFSRVRLQSMNATIAMDPRSRVARTTMTLVGKSKAIEASATGGCMTCISDPRARSTSGAVPRLLRPTLAGADAYPVLSRRVRPPTCHACSQRARAGRLPRRDNRPSPRQITLILQKPATAGDLP